MQATADLGQIAAFSSLVFLLVFIVVNAIVFRSWTRVLPVLGALGCAAAVTALGIHLYEQEPYTLAAVAVITGAVLMGRAAFLATRALRRRG